MNEYLTAIVTIQPKLSELERKLNDRLERTAVSTDGDTVRVIERVTAVVEQKRQLSDVAEAYRRLSSCLSDAELRLLQRRAAGMTEKAIADETGVTRRTVRAQTARLSRKCETVLAAMTRSGLDVADCRDVLTRYGGLPRVFGAAAGKAG